jgi:hypothetical protein
LFELKRSPDLKFSPNLGAWGWTEAAAIYAEFSALVAKRVEEISDTVRRIDYQLPSLRRRD